LLQNSAKPAVLEKQFNQNIVKKLVNLNKQNEDLEKYLNHIK
jgi:hypothetical protein